MDSALVYDTFEDRLLAAIVGRAVKDYVVSRTRNLICAEGRFNETAIAKCERKLTAKGVSRSVAYKAMLGCNRVEIRTLWQFMHEGGLEMLLEALAPEQDPNLVREFAEQAILGKKQVIWK